MKSIMLSIKPKYVELIANGKKTIEVRKTRPKIDTPFKCYIYCTKGKPNMTIPLLGRVHDNLLWICNGKVKQTYGYEYMCQDDEYWCLNGKVIGHFVCDRIDRIGKRGVNNNFDYCYLSLNEWGNDDIEIEITDIKKSCISKNELNSYGANADCLYGWHISDLVIYDEPREIGEFWAYNAELNKLFENEQDYCAWGSCETENGCTNDCDTENILNCYQCWADWNGWCHKLTRPPESWRYIDV